MCYQYFLHAYGLKTVALMHVHTLLQSIHRLHTLNEDHAGFRTFLRFLGMSVRCSCTTTPGGVCM